MTRSELVTVLFTDLVGSTELSTALGDVAADALRRDHFTDLRDAIEATDGTEVKTIGDAVMVTYSGAADALTGAIAMQQAVERRNRRSGSHPLEMRVGISAGDATFEEGDWFGTPVIEASRLCAEADGGQILVSDLVRALAGSRAPTEVRPIGERDLKGLSDPIAVCQVEWAADTPGSEVPLPGLVETDAAFPFAGRSGERDQLMTAWKEAMEGERRVMLVSGEPGIGKTRLVTEMVRAVHEQGAIVLWGRCDEELDVPYQPFAEALRHYAAAVPTARLEHELGPLGGELTRLLPELTQLVPAVDEPVRTEAETERHRLFESVADLVAAAADTAPVVLVLDDLHWADKPSLMMLRHLLRRSTSVRLLVVATYRDTDLDRSHPLADALADLRRMAGVDRLDLQGLDAGEVTAFMENAAGHDLDEPGLALAQAVHHETEGNPFFLGEMLRHLAESGLIVQRDGRWESDYSLDEVGIPEGIREVVGRRLSRLSDDANAALAIGAVIGPEFDMTIVEAAGGPAGDDLLDALDEAAGATIVQEVPGEVGRYRFAHALVRSTLYDELTTNRRLRMHWQIGEAIETRRSHELDGVLDQLAYHYGEGALAGDPTKAVEFGRRAGDRAMTELAFEAAAGHYDRAIAAQDLMADPDLDTRADLQIARTVALRTASDERARDSGLAAAVTARQLADPGRLARAALAMTSYNSSRMGTVDREIIDLLEEAVAGVTDDASPTKAVLLSRLAVELQWDPDEGARRRAIASQSLDLARTTGDRDALIAALLGGWTLIDGSTPFMATMGEFNEEALQHATDPVALIYLHRAMAARAACLGQRSAMEENDRRMREVAASLRQPRLIWLAMNDEATYSVFSGDIAAAEAQVVAAMQYGQENGVPEDMIMGSVGAIFYSIRMAQGRMDELVSSVAALVESQPGAPVWRVAMAGALSESEQADAAVEHIDFLTRNDFAAVPHDVEFPVTMCGIARLSRTVPLDDAVKRQVYDRLQPFTGTFNWSGASITDANDMGLGAICSQLGDFDASDHHFGLAIDLSRRAAAQVYEARSQLDWARALHARGDDRARAHAEAAATLATELGMDGPFGTLRYAEEILAT